MKTITHLLLALLSLATLSAAAEIKYPAQITFKVIDETGAPVSSGIVRASTFASWQPGEGFGRDIHDQYEARINKDGIAVLDAPSLRGAFAYRVDPEGQYYGGGGGEYKFKEVVNGRWEPWNPQLEIILMRIVNPIPMYARKLGVLQPIMLPADGPVGFDLMASDWVAPYGKGKLSDLIFEYKATLPMTDPTKAFESVLTVTFANKGDGIQSRLAPQNKRLLMLPRHAPEDGYESKWVKRIGRAREGAAAYPSDREDQNFIFRVRTVLDQNGNVVSAHYGKIYGDIFFDAIRHIRFAYYLNPTPLDRNLEFEPKKNLLPKKLSGADVSEP